jgi:quercetin dioxygenase-like cupin family protein
MAQVGETIENPLSGERLTFLETAATTNGEYLKVKIDMSPGGAVPRPHVHPQAEERFELTTGRIRFLQAGKTRVVEDGEDVIVPRGTSHVWGNPFNEPATVVVTLSPALKMETFFETWFGLAREGKVNARTQMPSLLQIALLTHDYRGDIGMPGLAGVVARGLGYVLSPLARARGYRSRYPQYSEPDSP